MNLTDKVQNVSTWSVTTSSLPSSEDFPAFLTKEERIILTTVFLLLFILGLLGNGVVIYAIISLGYRSSLDVPANTFILSQAVADMGTSLSIPIFITHVYLWNWDLFYIYTGFVWLASLGSVFLLTLNRLVSVLDGLKYPRRMTPFRSKLLVVIIWKVPFLISLYHLVSLFTSINYPNIGRYYIMLLAFSVVLFNAYMFRQSRIQARKIKKQHQIITGLQKNIKEDFKSMKTLAIVSGTLILSFLPFTTVVFLYGEDKTSTEFQRNAAFWGPLMAVNSVLDPVIYFFRSSEFRSSYQSFKRFYEQRKAVRSKAPLSVSNTTRRRVKARIHWMHEHSVEPLNL